MRALFLRAKSRNSGVSIAVLNVSCSAFATLGGAFAGRKKHWVIMNSRVLTPSSFSVGASGASGRRSSAIDASTRNLPPRTCGDSAVAVAARPSVWPPSCAVIAGPPASNVMIGASIFSASFALLGGQEIIEKWVTSLGLTPIEFLLLSQVIIFILGWPLEWTEIIVIFMPIFVPLLPQYGVDPLFFGLLVALNLQTAFLSPPVAMAAFYLKGVSPPHVTLNQIFAGMLPFMGIQVIAIFILYVFPQIGLWLPSVLYGN